MQAQLLAEILPTETAAATMLPSTPFIMPEAPLSGHSYGSHLSHSLTSTKSTSGPLTHSCYESGYPTYPHTDAASTTQAFYPSSPRAFEAFGGILDSSLDAGRFNFKRHVCHQSPRIATCRCRFCLRIHLPSVHITIVLFVVVSTSATPQELQFGQHHFLVSPFCQHGFELYQGHINTLKLE
ncbi:hypothetical protein BDN72DRAFT_535407 [Pluteus cervinus]|uniref:Uncharacterized protein n=1 Tax=Pluteus cervinus TaxID=181527 RepID=A0ACD3A3S2_9AGAR|nr:hypothetical protein BDN72DRAFT_535407 [Pluteus cervinus]